MHIEDLIVAFLLALLLSWLFVGPVGWRRRPADRAWSSAFFLFLFILMAGWAAALWIPPAGPLLMGTAWLPLLAVGLMVGLIFAAAVPPARERPPVTPEEEEAAAAGGLLALGLFGWLGLLLLGVVVVAALVAA